MLKTFKNTNYTTRNYEVTNVVACQAPSAPGPQWVECDPSTLDKLQQLWKQGDATYFGYL